MDESVMDANAAWAKAPAHIRMMAGQYVGPILIVLSEQAAKLAAIAGEVEKMKINNEAFQAGKMIWVENPELALDMLASAVAEKLMNGAKNGQS